MYLCYFLFFFKQKTAYEMRISDWSSDVCSSDLLDHLLSKDSRRIFWLCQGSRGLAYKNADRRSGPLGAGSPVCLSLPGGRKGLGPVPHRPVPKARVPPGPGGTVGPDDCWVGRRVG